MRFFFSFPLKKREYAAIKKVKFILLDAFSYKSFAFWKFHYEYY